MSKNKYPYSKILLLSFITSILFIQCSKTIVDPYLYNPNKDAVKAKGYDWTSTFTSKYALARKDNNFIIIDEEGQVVDSWHFENKEFRFSEGLARTKKDGYYGMLDDNLTLKVPHMFDNISEIGCGGEVIRATLNNKIGFYYISDNTFIPVEDIPESVGNDFNMKKRDCKNGYYVALQNGKYGLRDINDKIVVPFIYDGIRTVDKFNHLHVTKNGKKGVIDYNNNTIIPVESDKIVYISDREYCIVTVKNKVGLYDLNGQLQIPFNYDYLSIDTDDTYTIAEINNKKGLVKTKGGQTLIDSEYDEIRYLYTNFYHLKKDSIFQVFNVLANEFKRVKYDITNSRLLDNKRVIGTIDDKRVVINKDLSYDLLEDIERTNTSPIYQDSIKLKQYVNEKYGYGIYCFTNEKLAILNKNREFILHPIYDQINVSEWGFELVKDEHLGILDFNLDTLLDFTFHVGYKKQWKTQIENGLILKRSDNTYHLYMYDEGMVLEQGYKNIEPLSSAFPNLLKISEGQEGEWIYDISKPNQDKTTYQKINEVHNNLILVKRNGKLGGVDTNGEIILPINHESLSKKRRNHFISGKKNGLSSAISVNGSVIIEGQIQSLSELNQNLIKFQKNDLYGVVNHDGQIVVPAEYNAIPFATESGDIFVKHKETGNKFIHSNGKVKSSIPFSDVKHFAGDKYIVKNKSLKSGIINSVGDTLLDIKYRRIYFNQKGFLEVSEGNKTGIFNKDLEEVIPCLYDDITTMYRDFFKLEKDNLFGVAKRNGELIIPVAYKEIARPIDRHVWAKNINWSLYDMEGKQLIDTGFDDYEKLSSSAITGDKQYLVIENDKYGVVNVKDDKYTHAAAELIVPPIFDEFYTIDHPNAYIIGKHESKLSVFELDGTCITNCLNGEELISAAVNDSMHDKLKGSNKFDNGKDSDWVIIYEKEKLIQEKLFFSLKHEDGKLELISKGIRPCINCEEFGEMYINDQGNAIALDWIRDAGSFMYKFTKYDEDQWHGTLEINLNIVAQKFEYDKNRRLKEVDSLGDDIYVGNWILGSKEINKEFKSRSIEIKRKNGKLNCSDTTPYSSFHEIASISEFEEGLQIIYDTDKDTDQNLILSFTKVKDDKLLGKVSLQIDGVHAVRVNN